MLQTDVLIVGAGPAGLAAADVLTPYDIEISIIDEQARPGGQIYRQPPRQYKVRDWLSSRIYTRGKALLSRVSELEKIKWHSQSTVLGIADNSSTDAKYPHVVSISGPQGTQDIEASCVLIATGCYDMPLIFPGWTLPGVMATGGIQAFVKSQQIIPGERFLFVGTHPLQLIVADQIVRAGGNVVGVMFAQPKAIALELLLHPLVLLRHANKFIHIALTLLHLIKAGVAVRFNETIIEAAGDPILDGAILARLDAAGNVDKSSRRKLDCDRLGICFSFLASSELARQRGALCTFSKDSGGWIITANEWMGSSVSGLCVAGEICGVAGAEHAMEEGRLAGLGIAHQLAKLEQQEALELSKPVRVRLARQGKFATLLKKLSYPGDKLLDQLMTGESTLCKCEEISVDDFNNTLVTYPHISTANAAKLLCRTGMGLCQGRYCQFQIVQMLARKTSTPEDDIGPFTARFPSKPVRISELIK